MPGEKEFGVPGGMAGGLRTRLAGLGLTLIALGPTLVVATALVLTALAVIDLIRPLTADVSVVGAIVESRISPQIVAVESAFARVSAPLSQLQSQIEAALSAVEQVLGEVTKLKQLLDEIGTTVLDALAPLEATAARITLIGAATLAALVTLLTIYVVAGVLFVICRADEAGRAFRTSRALGFAGFIRLTLLSDGFCHLLGRMPRPSPEQATAELQQMIAQLETELAALRASLTSPRASPAQP